MHDWIKTISSWILAGIASWFAWFEANGHILAELMAATASLAAIIVTILHAITLKEKYKFYKEKRNEREL